MNKLLTSAAIAVSVAFMWLGFRLAAGTPKVQAAQCWDPGCCGYSLVYNQWSCQSAEASNMCRDMGENPIWVCNSNGLTHDDQDLCRTLRCNGQPCEWRCPISDWGNQCVIISGNVACSHPNDSTCTANVIAQQCTSQAGVNDCSNYNGAPDNRPCWVMGSGPTITPGPSPTGPAPILTSPPAPPHYRVVAQVFRDTNGDGIRQAGENMIDPSALGITVVSEIFNPGNSTHGNNSRTFFDMV